MMKKKQGRHYHKAQRAEKRCNQEGATLETFEILAIFYCLNSVMVTWIFTIKLYNYVLLLFYVGYIFLIKKVLNVSYK